MRTGGGNQGYTNRTALFNYGPLTWVAMANLYGHPSILILEANALRESSNPKGLNKNHFKEPIQFDGYYFKPSGKPGLGYQYDEKFVVNRDIGEPWALSMMSLLDDKLIAEQLTDIKSAADSCRGPRLTDA